MHPKNTTPPENSARLLRASEWAAAVLLSANLAWTSLCLGGVRAETMPLGWLLTGGALALVLLKEILTGGRGHWALYCMAPFMLYATASALFVSPVRWLGERDVWHWFQMFSTFGIALCGMQRRGPRYLVLASVALLGASAIVLSGYQLTGHESWLMLGRTQASQYIGRASGFFGNPNSLAALFVLLIPPFLALAWRRGASGVQRAACAYIALAFLAGLALTMSRGGLLALTLALLCWPWLVREWSLAKRARAFAAALVAVAIAASVAWAALPSLRERVHDLARNHGERSRPILWQASLKMTASSPLLGTGAGSFNTLFEKYRPEGFRDEPQWTHNDFLNTLGDYGIVGFALLFGGIGFIACRCGRGRVRIPAHAYPDELRADASFVRALDIGLLAFCLASLVDFHQKIPALAMIVAVLAAEVVKRREALVRAERKFEGSADPFDELIAAKKIPVGIRPIRAIAAVALLFLLAVFINGITDSYRAEAMRAAGRAQIDALAGLDQQTSSHPATLSQAGALLGKAITLDAGNAQAWADHSYVLAQLARIDKSAAATCGALAEISARDAIKLAPDVYEFWLRLGVALDLQGRAAEAGGAFARALNLAPASALVWYHQAYHLSLTPSTHFLALAAAETCLRLDPSYADADILRVRLKSNH